MKTTATVISSLIAMAFTGAVSAQTPGFEVEVARVQLNLTCEMSSANGGTTECTANVKSRGRQVIKMEESEDKKVEGFSGADAVKDDNGIYVLALSADTTKTLKNMTMMRMQHSADATEFEVSLVSNETNSLTALNISPLKIQLSESTIKVNLTVVAYAPAKTKNIVTASTTDGLVEYVLQKIQPAITAAKKH